MFFVLPITKVEMRKCIFIALHTYTFTIYIHSSRAKINLELNLFSKHKHFNAYFFLSHLGKTIFFMRIIKCQLSLTDSGMTPKIVFRFFYNSW